MNIDLAPYRSVVVEQTLLAQSLAGYASIIWDWNGTLIDDLELTLELIGQVCVAHGLEAPSVERHRDLFCFPVRDYYEALGVDLTRHCFEELTAKWLRRYNECLDRLTLFPETKPLLEYLSRDTSQFILSALPQIYLDVVVERYELQNVFNGVYGLPHAKADCKLERGRELLRTHEVDRTSCILVGDTAHDFEVAQELGIDILLVADGHQSYERLSRLTNRVIRSRYIPSRNG